MEEQEVVGFLIIVLYLIAVISLLDLWVKLRIAGSGLENVLRRIEEVERVNGGREDP